MDDDSSAGLKRSGVADGAEAWVDRVRIRIFCREEKVLPCPDPKLGGRKISADAGKCHAGWADTPAQRPGLMGPGVKDLLAGADDGQMYVCSYFCVLDLLFKQLNDFATCPSCLRSQPVGCTLELFNVNN